MKNGTMPVSALVLDFLPTGSVRIRTQRGTLVVDRTVKASSLRFASMKTCPHGVYVVNPRDWLGWNFCEHCPDCIAQLVDNNAELQGDLRMVRSTAKAALEFIDGHSHQKKRQTP